MMRRGVVAKFNLQGDVNVTTFATRLFISKSCTDRSDEVDDDEKEDAFIRTTSDDILTPQTSTRNNDVAEI